ncbi:MAG: sigma 54-interacting transcriptional regulator, partial [Myxococcales bacterium]|nr:sigma 54-interacting transcriptional regulator [Myxococcales bacterium]
MAFDPTQTAPRLVAARDEERARYLTCVHPTPAAPQALDGTLVIGRQPGLGGLTLDDTRASRAHAELSRVRGRLDVFRLRDLDSKNGTFLNGQRVTQEYLQTDAVIRIGDSVLVFSEQALAPGGAAPTPTEGESPALSALLARADRAGASGLPVLIHGPSGAGKERLSQRVHRASGRSGPLVAVNCATLSSELIASELFGHVRGAFSGAEG